MGVRYCIGMRPVFLLLYYTPEAGSVKGPRLSEAGPAHRPHAAAGRLV